jgi:hypothetical protein
MSVFTNTDFHIIPEKFRIKYPEYAEIHEWDNIKNEAKANYPVRFWLEEVLEPFIERYTVDLLYRVKWWFLHRFSKKHQYHVIRPSSLSPGYYDPMTQILHANMDLLKDFVEYNLERDRVDWSATDHHQKAWDDMMEIYDWWVNSYPNREEYELPEPPSDTGFLWFTDPKNENTPYMEEYNKVSDLNRELREKWDREEKDYLKKIVDVLDYMWY